MLIGSGPGKVSGEHFRGGEYMVGEMAECSLSCISKPDEDYKIGFWKWYFTLRGSW